MTIHAIYAQVKAIAEEIGVAFSTLGFDPKWKTVDVPIMPKNRYRRVRQSENMSAGSVILSAASVPLPPGAACLSMFLLKASSCTELQAVSAVSISHLLCVTLRLLSRAGSCGNTWPRSATLDMT